MRCLFALALLATVPEGVRAGDLTALYPDSAVFALGANIKGIATSPLGKKVIGNDKPFDAMQKLLRVLLPLNVFPVAEKSIKPLEAVANRLDRVSVAGTIDAAEPSLAIFLEGEVTEAEYIQAAEGFAKAENKPFKTEKFGDRKLLILGDANAPAYGVQVSKTLFIVTTSRELLEEVQEKYAGKRKAKVDPSLLEWMKKAKPDETPIWAAVGVLKVLDGIKGGVTTITLKDNADFRIEIDCGTDQLAGTLKTLLEQVVQYFDREQTPQSKVWSAAKITVSRNGVIVSAAGSIPGQLLIDEYSKQK